MFSRLSLKAKMLLAFVSISMLLLVVGGIGWVFNKNVVSIYTVITNQNLPNVQAIGRMRCRAQEVNRTMLRSDDGRQCYQELSKYAKDFQESLGIYADFTKKYLDVPFVPGEEALFNKVEDDWKKFAATSNDVFSNYWKKVIKGPPLKKCWILKFRRHVVPTTKLFQNF